MIFLGGLDLTNVKSIDKMKLSSRKINDQILIKSCPLNPFLRSMGVKEGIYCKVVSKLPVGGPVVIRIAQRDIAIDLDIAKTIHTTMEND